MAWSWHPSRPSWVKKAPSKTDCSVCLPGSCHVSLLLSVEAANQAFCGLSECLITWTAQSWRFQDPCLARCPEPGLCLFFQAIRNSEQSCILNQYPDATLPVLSPSSVQCQQHSVMITHMGSEINREWANIELMLCGNSGKLPAPHLTSLICLLGLA